ncbi:phosphatidylinositol 4-kinase gamma 7-like [Diospyros lotus]|uniref:phosphatidylinositol 4-kinase gamma 7-like n=1 Tax=Diospyros lotus TaxID=55363 RepID=UPI00224D8C61|nr:phosphatidylinositol 4-kinase gamma 7-like [Diospyros lotus]
MYPDLDNPVQLPTAVANFKIAPSHEYLGNKRIEGKSPRKRRIFVQTETGSVLGIELDGSDNARTVKKRLQLALNVPAEKCSLTYGDIVLKNDLSNVRNDSPLLLTKNSLHRSSSTPCLSPSGKDTQQGDASGPVEILGCSDHFAMAEELVKDVVKAIENGIDPVPICSGLGGAYYLKNCTGENVAIVKPTDEEPFAPNNPKGFVGKTLGQPGLKPSVRVGETGFREVAAYLLDYDHFANVPPTALVKITHPIFNVNDGVNTNKHQQLMHASKIASFQQFIPHDFDASDHGTSSFPVAAIHRIGILDIRILNTDRHAGNLLVKKLDGVGRFGQVELVPIDHGLCLPESLEDPYFEWIHWPQASIPFSEDELEYISHLDPVRDSEMLRMELPMIREACLRILVLCTTFLKEAAAFGLCLAEIGEMMSREFRGHEEEPSELEIICMEARKLLEEGEAQICEDKVMKQEEFQFDMECEESDLFQNSEVKMAAKPQVASVFKVGNGQNILSQLVANHRDLIQGQVPAISMLSTSLRSVNLGEQGWRHQGAATKGSCLAGKSTGNRSVNEQLPTSANFVKLADMNEEEWVRFLDIFQKLLYEAVSNRRLGNANQKQRQRLGTSCQF